MKQLFTLLFVFASFLGYAQNFIITNENGDPYKDGETISAIITEEDLNPYTEDYCVYLAMKNPTSEDILLHTLRTNIALPDSMRAWVCCFMSCPPDDIFQLSGTIESDSVSDFALHLMPQKCTGLAQFKLDFWTKEDQTDIFSLFVNIEVRALGVKEQGAINKLLATYPNPASTNSNINFSYTIPDNGENSRLVIRNLMGAVVYSAPLSPYENSLVVDASSFVSGVYFYAIENKNRIIVAKKLVIR